ncbi:MAG: FAD-binding oxidoreductase [Anaerolineales bacterium]|nr:FAD-binding oxidoreductase [Anaerolineales bacterium]
MTTHRILAQPIALRPARVLTNAAAIDGVRFDAAHFPDGYTTALAVPVAEAEVAWVLCQPGPVLPIGSQSSLTGGATPRGETVLALRELRGIEQAAPDRWRVGAGVTLAELQSSLATRAAFFPPVPAYAGAQIGGAASTNAAGPSTFKYGAMRQWIEGLRVVLADGTVLDIERGQCRAHPDGYFELNRPGGSRRIPVPGYHLPHVAKISAGYFAAPEMDLIDLFIGAEGTLGVITQVTVRVITPAPQTSLIFIPCPTETAALALTAALRNEAQQTWRGAGIGLDISAIEFLDEDSLALMRADGVDAATGIHLGPPTRAALIVQREHGTAAREAEAVLRLQRLLVEAGAETDLLVAGPGDVLQARRIVDLRTSVALGVNARIGLAQQQADPRISKVAADMIVPFEHVTEMLRLFREEFGRLGLMHAIWGHISDGNLHPNALPRNAAEAQAGQAAILRLGRLVTAMGGSPLAEHGVGRNPTKQALLRQLYGDAGIEQMRSVKAALDPAGKLAPGVIFPASADLS